MVAFCPTGGDKNPGTSTLTVPLNSGSLNTIEFEAYNGGWGMSSLLLVGANANSI